MLDISDKLKMFSTEVIGEANKVSEKKWQEFVEKLEKEYDGKETQFLEEGYYIIQNGLKQIDKEKSSRLSKSLMDNRQTLLQKRAKMVEQVFNNVQAKLVEFTQTSEYLTLLEKRIEQTLEILGEGKCRIVLTAKDYKRATEIMKKYSNVTFEAEEIQVKRAMIGGCQGYNEQRNLFFDNSFVNQLEVQRGRFLQKVAIDLKIEE